jgi:hypothetical protein
MKKQSEQITKLIALLEEKHSLAAPMDTESLQVLVSLITTDDKGFLDEFIVKKLLNTDENQKQEEKEDEFNPMNL